MTFFPFLSWFRPWWKTSETDYETVLGRLSKDITAVQNRLVRINQRERRASVTLTLYAVLVWLGYAVFVWYCTYERQLETSKAERFKAWIPVVIGLLAILCTRFVVRWWYGRIAEGEEKHLRSLQRTRRKKIDEIKQATRYDHLKGLLEKYDDTAPKSADGSKANLDRKRASASRQNSSLQARQQNQAAQNKGATPADTITTNGNGNGNGNAANGIKNETQALNTKGIATSLPPQRRDQFQRTWMDRVADKILGAETAAGQGVTAAEQRYALICHICFTHNGLCPKEEWEEVQYICPRCGTFNSRRPSTVPTSSPWSHADHERSRTFSNASSRASTPAFLRDRDHNAEYNGSRTNSEEKQRKHQHQQEEEEEAVEDEEEEEEPQEEVIEEEDTSRRASLRSRRARASIQHQGGRTSEMMEVD